MCGRPVPFRLRQVKTGVNGPRPQVWGNSGTAGSKTLLSERTFSRPNRPFIVIQGSQGQKSEKYSLKCVDGGVLIEYDDMFKKVSWIFAKLLEIVMI